MRFYRTINPFSFRWDKPYAPLPYGKQNTISAGHSVTGFPYDLLNGSINRETVSDHSPFHKMRIPTNTIDTANARMISRALSFPER